MNAFYETEDGEYLEKMVPIRITALTWIPQLVIYALPNEWWGILIKIALALWVVVMIMNSFGRMYDAYKVLGAFTVYTNILFAAILYWDNPSWLIYIFIGLQIVAFGALFNQIKQNNERLDKLEELKGKHRN